MNTTESLTISALMLVGSSLAEIIKNEQPLTIYTLFDNIYEKSGKEDNDKAVTSSAIARAFNIPVEGIIQGFAKLDNFGNWEVEILGEFLTPENLMLVEGALLSPPSEDEDEMSLCGVTRMFLCEG